MKKLFVFLASVALIASFVLAAPLNNLNKGVKTFQWDYPTNELSASLHFNLYYTTNLNTNNVYQSDWVMATNIAGTATFVTANVLPGKTWWVCTASNSIAGESDISNVLALDVPRKPNNLR